MDWEKSNTIKYAKISKKIIEAKVKLLEKQKTFLGQQAFIADKKAIIFDTMIDIAEKEYQINIQKNSSPEQSTIFNKKNNKQ